MYAAGTVNYNDSTKTITATAEIKELVINGVHIGTNTTSTTPKAEEGRIEATNIRVGQYLHVGTQLETSTIVGNGTNGGKVNINGALFTNEGVVEATSLSLNGTDVKNAIEAKADQTDVDTNSAAIKTLEGRTTNISYDATNGTEVDGVKFKAGAVSGVKSINDNLQFEADGIYLNKGDSKNQIKFGADGKIIIGTSSSTYDTDGFYAGGHDFGGAKAAIDGKDGKIKGANGDFGVDEHGNVTTKGYIKGKDITAEGNLTVDGDAEFKKDLKVTGNIVGKDITASGTIQGATLKVNDNNLLDNNGLKAEKAVIDNLTIDGASITSNNPDGSVGVAGITVNNAGALNNVTAIDGVSVAQNSGSVAGGLTFGNNAVIGATGIPFQSTGFKVDDDGDVEGKTFTTAADGTGNRSTLASGQLTIDSNNTWTKDNGIIASNVKVGTNELKGDGLHVGTNTLVKDGEVTVGAGNSWSMANGIAATKASINGVTIGETAGKAVFNKAGKSTTIDGDEITTGTITADKLNVDQISLGKGTDKNITIGSNGEVTTKGDIKIIDAAGNVMSKLSQDQATFGKDIDNQTTINQGKLKAKVKDGVIQQTEFNFDENGLTVSGQNATSGTSSFGFNAANGIGTFTGQDGTTTAIKGSAITSTNGAATGVLNGSNLDLTLTDATGTVTRSTALTAGDATFTKDGKTTTISGDTITTGTLNVTDIVLGGTMYDTTGHPLNGKLSIGNDGHLRAANGNFDVKADGTFTNTVGNTTGKTTLKTDTTGASMKFDNITPTGGVNSEVSVADNSAKISAGASSIEVKNDGITNNGVTTFNGTTGTTTKIDGGTITTNHLITDKLTITGSGNADGTGSTTGSIAFGGDGTITSNIKDATTGKEATFKTDEKGTFTEAKDGSNVTTNTVNAQGNTNVVTDGTNTSTATQTVTSIGGVVTNGTVKIAQTLDGANGNITNEVTDKDGKSSQLVQNGTGLVYTDSANTGNATRINSSDVSIGSATDDSDRINLSDLGQIDDLDGELTTRPEYTSNPTAVGGINAEAAIRREEVARLDNRIDDVNNRVDKVGAMAAAIASLKSIGYDPQAPSEFSIGLGQYKGETGVAMGFFHYPNKNFMINVSLSTAGGETMGGIGATWRFGHKSPQKLLDEQREAQARKELAAAEKYQAAAKLAKEAQERAEYAAKLARQAQVSADNAKAAADATQAKHFQ